MKKLITLSAAILISTLAFSQNSKSDRAQLKAKVIEVLSDSALNVPYATTTNHDKYKNQLMRLLIEKKDSTILSIVRTKAFYSFIVCTSNGIDHPVSNTEIIHALNEFRANLPKDISYSPNIITEDKNFGDASRSESWVFDNNKGVTSKMTVMFINGQITNILVTL